MKAPGSSSLSLITALVVLACGSMKPALADTGGGGVPATPWRIAGPQNAEEIEKAKAVAATCQTLSVPARLLKKEWKEREDLVGLRPVALVAAPRREGDQPVYELAGRSSSGTEIKLPFSQIESFLVLARNRRTITVSASIWPAISAEELLATQPTYKQLVEGYRRELVLILRLKSVDGRALAFADEDLAVPLSKLVVGTRYAFNAKPGEWDNPRRFWWAMPSVAEDEDYPHRIISRD